jgi:JAB1/Mov34/MPN/PAD-1 ubiquitin protease
MSAVRVLRQQMPLARSILWAPASAPRPADVAFPVFLRQSALQAIYEHLATPPPPGQGILGFMLGDCCECPVTGVSYSVIDAALRLNQTIYGDRSRDVVTRLWKRVTEQLEAQQAQLIGWYHTHAPLPLDLSVHDVETHEQYFREPWQVALLVGTDPATPAGAFFRAGSDEAWVRTPLPFYELLNEDSVRPGGKKRSFMTWKTYRAYNPPALQPRAAPGAAAEPRAAAPAPPAPPAPPKSASRVIPRPVDEHQPELGEFGREEPTGLENMPQAELGEPGRIELEEPSAPAQPTRADKPEEEEWEDPRALRFLSAAEDAPPPLRLQPAGAHSPPPPPPAPAAPVASDTLPFIEGVDLPLEDEQLEEQPPEESAPPPPERRAARRRASRGRARRWIRIILTGLFGLLFVAAGGVATLQFGPRLLQQVRAFAPGGHTPASHNQPSVATPRSAAPRPAAPPPAVPRPSPTPRPEFALLDQMGDSLARALQAYDGRLRLFEKRALDCPALGRGMVRVERAVARYGVQRNAMRATLDSDRVAWDRELRAGVDSAARQFQRSQCERP